MDYERPVLFELSSPNEDTIRYMVTSQNAWSIVGFAPASIALDSESIISYGCGFYLVIGLEEFSEREQCYQLISDPDLVDCGQRIPVFKRRRVWKLCFQQLRNSET